ncbi:MAG: hypothetical protein ACLT74_06250 [Christensenellales bacterium]
MSNVATKAKKPNLSVKSVLNWILDHAMIIVIVLLALYVQTQRDAFLKPAHQHHLPDCRLSADGVALLVVSFWLHGLDWRLRLA